MKKLFTVSSLVFIGAFFLSAVISVPAVEAATYNFTYSTFFPPTHIQTKVPEAWIKEIEELSKGQIKIQLFTGGSLTPAPQIYDGVVKGISDFGLSVFAYSPGRFPVVSAVDNPFGWPNAFVATRVINELNRKFKPKELSDVHVCYLYRPWPRRAPYGEQTGQEAGGCKRVEDPSDRNKPVDRQGTWGSPRVHVPG